MQDFLFSLTNPRFSVTAHKSINYPLQPCMHPIKKWLPLPHIAVAIFQLKSKSHLPKEFVGFLPFPKTLCTAVLTGNEIFGAKQTLKIT